MDNRIVCPKCSSAFEFDRQLVPAKVSCSDCDHKFIVEPREIGAGVSIGGYEIKGTLGAGGMGEVYLATQLSMDREVALKILKPTVTHDPEDIKAFIREARLLAKLDHPNIVTAFDFGEAMGVFYLAMAYIEGEDIADRLERDGQVPEKEALEIAIKVAKGLSYAWDKHHLLHRDINPANIMMDKFGDVRIMDLGIGKTMSDDGPATTETMLVGTPNYMSPEAARGEDILDFRADMFSLGATLHFMVTGVMPFDDDDPFKVLESVRTETLPAASKLNPDVSPQCSSIIQVMMAKAASDRFPTWTEAISKIEALLEKPAASKKSPAQKRKPTVSGARRKSSRKMVRKVSGKLIPPQRPVTRKNVLQRKKSNAGTTFMVLVILILAIGGGSVWRKMGQENKTKEVDAQKLQEIEDAKLAKELQEKLGNQYRRALLYLEREPPEYRKALKALKDLEPSAFGTEFEIRIAKKMATLRVELASLPDGADGPVEPDVPPVSASPESTAAMEIIHKKMARFLLDHRFSLAQELLAEERTRTWPAKHRAELEGFRTTVDRIERLPFCIADSYNADLGGEIYVSFKKGRERLHIGAVRDDVVVGQVVLRSDGKPLGGVERTFRADDLTIEEQSNRIARDVLCGDLMKALLAYKAGDTGSCRKILQKSDNPVGVILLEEVEDVSKGVPDKVSGPRVLENPVTSEPVLEVKPPVTVATLFSPLGNGGHLSASSAASISDRKPNVPYGAKPTDLSIYHFTTGEDRTLLRFDLGQVPADKSVARAELQMEALIKHGRNNGEAMSIYFVKRPWDPVFVSWTEVSKGTLWTTAGGDFEEEEMSWSTAVPVGGQTVTWDVTGMVNAWMGGQKDNHGMLINSSHNAGGNGLNFVSKTRARMKQQGPRLYLTFK